MSSIYYLYEILKQKFKLLFCENDIIFIVSSKPEWYNVEMINGLNSIKYKCKKEDFKFPNIENRVLFASNCLGEDITQEFNEFKMGDIEPGFDIDLQMLPVEFNLIKYLDRDLTETVIN